MSSSTVRFLSFRSASVITKYIFEENLAGQFSKTVDMFTTANRIKTHIFCSQDIVFLLFLCCFFLCFKNILNGYVNIRKQKNNTLHLLLPLCKPKYCLRTVC